MKVLELYFKINDDKYELTKKKIESINKIIFRDDIELLVSITDNPYTENILYKK